MQQARREAGPATGADEDVEVPGRGVPREEEHRLAREVGEAHARTTRQPMPLGKNGDERLARDRVDDEARLVHRETDEADVDPAVTQRFGLRRREQRVQLDVDVGEARAPDAQHARQDVEVGRGDEPDREPPDFAASRALRHALRTLRLRQDLAGVSEERTARGRQLDAALRPVEEHDSELLLELADLLAQRRLRDPHPRGRAAEVQLLRDGDEVAEVAELHPAAVIHDESHRCHTNIFDE
jgi:hypothetical protein